MCSGGCPRRAVRVRRRVEFEPELRGDHHLLAERSERLALPALRSRTPCASAVSKNVAPSSTAERRSKIICWRSGTGRRGGRPHAAEPDRRDLRAAGSESALLHRLQYRLPGRTIGPHREPTALWCDEKGRRAASDRRRVARSPSFVGERHERSSAESNKAPGPLVVSSRNPRYFAVREGTDERAVYPASHLWNNLHDGMGPGKPCADEPERMDFGEYLDFLDERGHNFIRLWRWEQFRSYTAAADYHLCMSPQPWARTGSGEATDGKPKFDLRCSTRSSSTDCAAG